MLLTLNELFHLLLNFTTPPQTQTFLDNRRYFTFVKGKTGSTVRNFRVEFTNF